MASRPMQIKFEFLCRDSVLAAPLVLDFALFSDLGQRAGMHLVHDWLRNEESISHLGLEYSA